MADTALAQDQEQEDDEATRKRQERFDSLDAFGLEIARLRREAIDGRALLGIEDEWLEDEEAYIGVDEANRHEYRSTWRHSKPAESGSTWSTEDVKKRKQTTKATGFLNITRPYVDAAAARMADMLLPNDDKAWGIEPTPIPDLEAAMASDEQIAIDAAGTMAREGDLAAAIQEVAAERADKAEKRIEDWLAECRWHYEARKTLEDASRIGTGILKGPIPRRKRRVNWRFEGFRSRKEITFERLPYSIAVDPWNVYPDPACGENVQDGNYIFEKDDLTQKRLLELKHEPGYIPEQIDKAMLEGPIKPEAHWTPSQFEERTSLLSNEKFEIWYYYGMVEAEKLVTAGMDPGELAGEKYLAAIVTMVNHRVIKAVLNPLDDGTFPYDFMIWQKRPGMPWGIGVSRQIRVPQRQLNAANRNMMDNAALSGGPQIVVNTNVIVPVDGTYDIYPRKVWVAKDGADMAEVDKAFRVANIDCRQEELARIIEFSLRMAEEATGLPMILQGQMGEKAPDTVGGMRMLQNNASSVLRRLAKTFDDSITVPHIQRYYHWLMEYGTDESEKGDYQIIARGSGALVERDLQNQELALITQLSADPAYGIDPKKAAEEYLRSRRFDPKEFQPDPEEAAGQAQPDPKVQEAAIKAETEAEAKALELADKERDRQHETEIESMKELNDRQMLAEEAELRRETGSGI